MENEEALVKYVSPLVGKIYIHRHIYDIEILTPKRIRDQIDTLIAQGKAEIVDLSSLSSQLEKAIYQEIITLLQQADAQTKELGKNWGEIVSLAFAKASGIPYFLADEKDLQSLADEHLNTGDNQDIEIIRVRDFILALKEAGFKRKECYLLWMIANIQPDRNEQSRKWASDVFKNELWVLEGGVRYEKTLL